MRILFVFPNYAPIGGGGIPIGLSILISIAKQKGHETALFDTSFKLQTFWYNPYTNFSKTENDWNYRKDRKSSLHELSFSFQKYVKAFDPNLICFSTITPTYEIGISLINGIEKKKNRLIIFGGIHPTVCPEEVIGRKNIDIICVGEGEIAFSTLLDRLESGKDYTDIDNLWIKKDGQVIKNNIGSLIHADRIPLGDFCLFEDKHFYRVFKGKKIRSLRVEISRGCVYKCAYCSSKKLRNLFKGKGRYFRYKSVKRSIAELALYKKRHNIEMFFFKDEVFLMLPKRCLEEFALEYKSKINLPFFCQSSAKDISEEKVKVLKDIGCAAMAIGVEAGNENFRKKVLNKPVSNKEILRAVTLLVKHGIRVTTYFMIGLPYETRELIFDTIEFQRKLYDLGTCPTHINCFHPFPGCELTEIAKREGFLIKDFDHKKTTTVSGLNMPYLSSKEIEGLYRTYAAYTRVDKWMYPIVQLCEAGQGKDKKILEIINQHYSER